MPSLTPLAPRIFYLFDNNRDGTVDVREILCGFSILRNSQGDNALHLCFQMYVIDRSGCITKEEVASLLRDLDILTIKSSINCFVNKITGRFPFEQALPEDCLSVDITEHGKLDEIFDRMHANSDGKVTFDDFKAAMQRDSFLQDVLLTLLQQK